MKLDGLWRARLAQGLLSTAIVIALLLGARTRAQDPGNNPLHLTTDWSHRHMVFSPPTSFWQAWELQKEPRYWHQWTRRNEWALRSANVHIEKNDRDRGGDRDHDGNRDHDGDDASAPANDSMRRDWAMSLGANGTVGAGQFPAKFSFDVNATPSCTADYVAFTTSLAGSATAPSIVAFDNLYATQGSVGGFCNVNGPSVKWAYNTNPALDTTGTTLTSPVLSSDGTKIAFVESRTNANGGSILHILKWKPGAGVTVQGTIAAPATPDTLMAAGQAWNTTNCPAANSCIVNMIFNAAQPDTASAPYYNYVTDELYVGDNNGVLHKFTGVFLGTPAEVGAAGNWPITVNTGAILTGAVFDGTSKNIFVGDSTGRLSFIKEVGSATGACGAGSPPCLGGVSQALTGAIVDAPYVDRSTGRVLVFDGTETTKQGSVFQFDTGLTTASKVTVGIGGNGTTPPANLPFDILHGGAFDDAYFSAGPGSGHLYTCGKDPGFNNRPAIYQLSFTGPVPGPAGVLVTTGIPAPLVNLTTAYSVIGDACSPVTEIKNGATDRIFFSFTTNANPPSGGGTATGCTAGPVAGSGPGCVASIVLGGTWPPAATTAGIAVPFLLTGTQTGSGGTSGIVVDNVGAGVQESSIYYTFRTNSTAAITCNATTGVGCAVKVTQSALQ
jgi:hypothetical protein